MKHELSGIAIVDDYDNDSDVYHILFTDMWLLVMKIVNFEFCGFVGYGVKWSCTYVVSFLEL